jgi:hypothetical protein
MGTAVGLAAAADATSHATAWFAGGTAATDLNSLLSPKSYWRLTEASSISDTGFIIGIGKYDPDGTGPDAAYGRAFTMLVPQAGTYGKGDATLDTKVNFDDLLLAQHYGEINSALDVHVADLNLDGSVNFADLLTLAQNYGTNNGQSVIGSANPNFAGDWALAQSLVPEPSSFATLIIAVAAAGRRRR